jgi:hypothetical protein
MAGDRELRELQAAPEARVMPDLMRALGGPAGPTVTVPPCEHLHQYLHGLELLAVGMAQQERLGDRAPATLRRAIAGTASDAPTSQLAATNCAVCEPRLRTLTSLLTRPGAARGRLTAGPFNHCGDPDACRVGIYPGFK